MFSIFLHFLVLHYICAVTVNSEHNTSSLLCSSFFAIDIFRIFKIGHLPTEDLQLLRYQGQILSLILKMGSSKSKPVIESARSVIARRKKELPATISESVSQSVSDTLAPAPSSTISYEAPGSNDSGFSAMTLHQMSNMGEYVQSTSYQVS
jgi:hypothetical protein